MGVLRFVVRIGVAWVISLVVAVAAMELGHRFVVTMDQPAPATATEETPSAVSAADEPGQAPPATRF